MNHNYYSNNKIKFRKISNDYGKLHQEKLQTATRVWREAHKEHCAKLGREWKKNNIEAWRAIKAKRRATKMNAIPSWINKKSVILYYQIANLYTELYDEPYQVDHIIPLQGENVCGLHVENNLQILTAKDNQKKGNRICQRAA